MAETDLLTMDGKKLRDWWSAKVREVPRQLRDVEAFVALRDAIVTACEDRVTKHYDDVAKGREQEAARMGAFEVLTMLGQDCGPERLDADTKLFLIRHRDRYFAPLPPRECVHDLKVWPQFFAAILSGDKTFEWRKDDRGFEVGDTLLLREWEPNGGVYTGREVRCTVSYVLRDGFNVPDGYAVLGFKSFAAGVGR